MAMFGIEIKQSIIHVILGPYEYFRDTGEQLKKLFQHTGARHVYVEYVGECDANSPWGLFDPRWQDKNAWFVVSVAHVHVPKRCAQRCVALYTEHELPEAPCHTSPWECCMAWHFSPALCRPRRLERLIERLTHRKFSVFDEPFMKYTYETALNPSAASNFVDAIKTPQCFVPFTWHFPLLQSVKTVDHNVGHYAALEGRTIDVIMPLNTPYRRRIGDQLRRRGLTVVDSPWNHELHRSPAIKKAKMFLNVHAKLMSTQLRIALTSTTQKAPLILDPGSPLCAFETHRMSKLLQICPMPFLSETSIDEFYFKSLHPEFPMYPMPQLLDQVDIVCRDACAWTSLMHVCVALQPLLALHIDALTCIKWTNRQHGLSRSFSAC